MYFLQTFSPRVWLSSNSLHMVFSIELKFLILMKSRLVFISQIMSNSVPMIYLSDFSPGPHCLYNHVTVAQQFPTLCNPMDYTGQNSLGQNTGVGSLSFLQGIFPTQGLNPGLPHCIDNCSIIISVEVWQFQFPHFVLFLQYCVGYSGSFASPLESICQYSYNNSLGF